MTSKLGLLACSALIAAISISSIAQAGEAVTSAVVITQKLAELEAQFGEKMDVETRYMNAAQIACGTADSNGGAPVIADPTILAEFAARHPLMSQYATRVIYHSTSGTSFLEELNSDNTKKLEQSISADIDKTLKKYDGSSLLCSELAGRQLIASNVLGGIVNSESNMFVNSLTKSKLGAEALTSKIYELAESCGLQSEVQLEGDGLMAKLNERAIKAYGQATVLDANAFTEEVFPIVMNGNIDLNSGKALATCEDLKTAMNRVLNIAVDIDHRVQEDITYFGFSLNSAVQKKAELQSNSGFQKASYEVVRPLPINVRPGPISRPLPMDIRPGPLTGPTPIAGPGGLSRPIIGGL